MAPTAAALRRQLDDVDAEAFDRALIAEGIRRADDFLRGIEAYRQHPYRRALPPVPVVWREGTTELLDYSEAGSSGPPVIVIPSLINRAYILDLSAKRSFMRHLGAKGFKAYLVDWGAPGPGEAGFGLDDYVAGRLRRLLDVVVDRDGPPALIGYCMGGLLALALGVICQSQVSGLALLATPWDFHAPTIDHARRVDALRAPLANAIDLFGGLPVDLLQTLFASIDPPAIERKFRAFGKLPVKGAKARDFVAVEDWLNDGVPLVGKLARECLFDWYVDNRPARGEWRIGEASLSPSSFGKPALALIPSRDRIVPPSSALALANALPKGETHVFATGHIGMVAGEGAKTNVYRSITKWLAHLGDT